MHSFESFTQHLKHTTNNDFTGKLIKLSLAPSIQQQIASY